MVKKHSVPFNTVMVDRENKTSSGHAVLGKQSTFCYPFWISMHHITLSLIIFQYQ